MVPWQLVTVVAVWSLRTRWSPWLATVLAIWPLNAFFWEFKFDLVPTAALAVGLLLASRGRWRNAGVALGLGAALKWTPALAGIALVIWLLSRGRRRDATSHLLALAGTFLLRQSAVPADVPARAARVLPAPERPRDLGRIDVLHPAGDRPGAFDLRKSRKTVERVPGWANVLAAVLQLLLVALVLVLVTRVEELRAAVALAAMAPVVFLLSNRVFSPQYLVTIVAAWCLAGAMLVASRREQLMLGLVIFAVTLANVLVYPTGTALWPTFTVILFLLGFLTTGWLVGRSVGAGTARSR